MINIAQLSITFNPNSNLENKVLKNINLTINDQDFVTIIGGNGAGKSTLMNVIAGKIMPTNGKVFIDNEDVSKKNVQQRSKNIARVFQDPMIGTCADLTITENLILALKRGQKRGFNYAYNSKKLAQFKEILANLDINLVNRINDKVSMLSGGQRQIISLIMATIVNSKILLLDEHTAALDPKAASIVLKLTKQLIEVNNLTVLMITHSMQQALEYGNRTIMMSQGEIIKDLDQVERSKLTTTELIKFFDS